MNPNVQHPNGAFNIAIEEDVNATKNILIFSSRNTQQQEMHDILVLQQIPYLNRYVLEVGSEQYTHSNEGIDFI